MWPRLGGRCPPAQSAPAPRDLCQLKTKERGQQASALSRQGHIAQISERPGRRGHMHRPATVSDVGREKTRDGSRCRSVFGQIGWSTTHSNSEHEQCFEHRYRKRGQTGGALSGTATFDRSRSRADLVYAGAQAAGCGDPIGPTKRPDEAAPQGVRTVSSGVTGPRSAIEREVEKAGAAKPAKAKPRYGFAGRRGQDRQVEMIAQARRPAPPANARCMSRPAVQGSRIARREKERAPRTELSLAHVFTRAVNTCHRAAFVARRDQIAQA